ncbi:hypothetical protein [Prevotella sp. 10(H)]|uniref:hypothetical protein n=1 Tax=Prevotella sp. 10(H) TaxID=1158294 RepID=UPI0004A77D58|nr:hypothetical protein [Prevotella sp. 10(H)]
MKKLVFILLLAVPAIVYSQTEVPKDSFPPLKKESLKIDEKLDNYLQLNGENANNQAGSKASLYHPLLNEDKEYSVPDLHLPPLDVYLGPPLESNTFTKDPFANDFSFSSGHIYSDRMWLSSRSSYVTYPLLGASRDVSMRFNYQPLEWLAVSAGPYASKYNLFGATYNDGGVNGSIKFILHDRIRLNGYGQYSLRAKHNGVAGPMLNMYPSTYYGGTIEVKVTQKFGIEGGVIRELNPFNGKWVNRPYFAPVFYVK